MCSYLANQSRRWFAGPMLILAAILATASAQPPQKIGVIISLKQGPDQSAVAQASIGNEIKRLGGNVTHQYNIIRAVAAELPEAAVLRLMDNPAVELIELDGEFQVNVEETPWGITKIRALENPANGGAIDYAGGAGVVVAVLDSGIDLDHQDLAANIYTNENDPIDGIDNDGNGLVDDYYGWNFNGNNNNPDDDNGHGSHCAGTIAGVGNNDVGVVGVAPSAKLLAVKVMNRRGSGSFSDIIAGIDYCVALKAAGHNILVTSNSYGASGNPGSAVEAAFNAANAAGIINMAAAGNEGNSSGTGESVGWPANYDSVVAVASTTSTDGRSSFSSTGANVEIAAPGSSILSTWKKGGYNTISGTSMACPHAAGAAAILMAENSAISPGEVRALLAATAVDLGSTDWDPQFGFGRIDVYAARGGTDGGGGGDTGGGGGDTGGGGGPETGVIQVQSISYAATGRRGRDLSITVAVVDGNGAPLSGAVVLLNLQGPGGDYGTASGTTATDGTVQFRLSRATRGTYTSTVVDLSLVGYTWDATDPKNTYVGNY